MTETCDNDQGEESSHERAILVTYAPGTTELRSTRPDGKAARADADALRRAADVIDGWADREERLDNSCKGCGDCYHPAIGTKADGRPWPWCGDCGCHADEHTRMAWVTSPPTALRAGHDG